MRRNSARGVFLSTVSEPFDKVLRYGESLDFFDPDALGTRVFYDDLGTALVTDGIKGLVDQVDEHLKELQPGVLVIDSLGDMLLASPGQMRFRELIHSLVQRCTRGRVSLLFTYEVAELFGATRLSDRGISNLSDNVVVLQYYRTGTEVRRSLTVLKTRGSGHTPEVREFHIGNDGLTLGDPVDVGRET